MYCQGRATSCCLTSGGEGLVICSPWSKSKNDISGISLLLLQRDQTHFVDVQIPQYLPGVRLSWTHCAVQQALCARSPCWESSGNLREEVDGLDSTVGQPNLGFALFSKIVSKRQAWSSAMIPGDLSENVGLVECIKEVLAALCWRFLEVQAGVAHWNIFKLSECFEAGLLSSGHISSLADLK